MKYFPAAGVKARRIIILILGMFLTSSIHAAAATYEQFKEPHGDFSITYPSAWQRSVGLRTVRFIRPAGREVEIIIGGYPLDRKDPPTAEAYSESSLGKAALYGYQIHQNKKISISNISATRLEYSSKLGVDQHGKKTSDRMFTDVEIVISHGSHYHVLSLSSLSADAVVVMPEFDRMVDNFKVIAAVSITEANGTAAVPAQDAEKKLAAEYAEWVEDRRQALSQLSFEEPDMEARKT